MRVTYASRDHALRPLPYFSRQLLNTTRLIVDPVTLLL